MRIACPHCGDRSLQEFVYYGDATVRRPAADAPFEDWHAFVYLRDNPSGAHRELWYHSAGCHAWLVVTRNMRTHEIGRFELARDVALAQGVAR